MHFECIEKQILLKAFHITSDFSPQMLSHPWGPVVTRVGLSNIPNDILEWQPGSDQGIKGIDQ